MRIDCAVVFIGVTLKKTSLARQAESPQPRITASRSQKRSQYFIRTHNETLSVAMSGTGAVSQKRMKQKNGSSNTTTSPPCEPCFALWGHAVDRAVASTSRTIGLRYIYESQEGGTMLILREVTQGKPPG
jgi:hypothetical protein